MSFSLGIVGLPNVGKSTLFQALTKNKVDASNYPFCTIDPNVGVVTVPDERLQKLAALSKSAKIIPTAIEFVDIAGLVKGASKGEGLGNKFLQNIREVDAIAEVIRLFDDPDVIHVHGDVNPEADKAVINLELILADLELAERRLDKTLSALKGPKDKILEADKSLLEKIVGHLRDEKLINTLILTDEERILARKFNFLTIKPLIYIHNVDEKRLKEGVNSKEDTVAICAKLESELTDIPDEELPAYLEQLGLSKTGLDQLITASYRLLNLVTFLTTGPEETRAWTVEQGATAPQAAGVIHTDFQKGFIRAEIVSTEELLKAGSWTKAKELGMVRIEGKDYRLKDGDVVYFHSNP